MTLDDLQVSIMPHQILMQRDGAMVRYTFTRINITEQRAARQGDPLVRLCRRMVGYRCTGPAEVRDEAGTLHLTIHDISRWANAPMPQDHRRIVQEIAR